MRMGFSTRSNRPGEGNPTRKYRQHCWTAALGVADTGPLREAVEKLRELLKVDQVKARPADEGAQGGAGEPLEATAERRSQILEQLRDVQEESQAFQEAVFGYREAIRQSQRRQAEHAAIRRAQRRQVLDPVDVVRECKGTHEV